jgi:hypothetical protein
MALDRCAIDVSTEMESYWNEIAQLPYADDAASRAPLNPVPDRGLGDLNTHPKMPETRNRGTTRDSPK